MSKILYLGSIILLYYLLRKLHTKNNLLNTDRDDERSRSAEGDVVPGKYMGNGSEGGRLSLIGALANV